MKNMRKLFAMVLAVMMVMSLATTAFAAATGSITITPPTGIDADATNTYKIYKVFDAVGDGDNISYTLVDGKTDAPAGFTVDTAGNVTYTGSGANGQLTTEDIAAIAAYVTEADLVETVTSTGSANAVAEGLANGYYYITTTTGTAVAITSTNPDATVTDKNLVPDIEKTVKEDSTGEYGETNDAEIGEIVEFKTVIKAYAGAQNYVLHDKMSNGLTLNQDSIKIENLIKDTDYTVNFNTTDECDFEITFTQAYLDKITGTAAAPAEITVTYSATVNENAVIAGTGNSNETGLDYGEENETEWDETITYVWEFDVLKYYNATEEGATTENALAGAKFVLYYTDSEDVKHYATITEGKLTDWTTTESEATVLVSGTDGKITIDGLDSGTYYLKETEAPEGYNKLASDVTVVIDEQGNVTDSVGGTPLVNKTVKVENKAGSVLPSTGGMGTTLFYVIGGIMMLAAVVLLVTKKRMSVAE